MADAPAARPSSSSKLAAFLADSYIFDWQNSTLISDIVLALPIAACLAAGIALGHPAAGMIAAGGAMLTGFGVKHCIDRSRLRPMILVTLGMACFTFIGMVAGRTNVTLVLIVTLAAFGYGTLSRLQDGIGWVGQQCLVMLIVASAYPFSGSLAAMRSLLILAGGTLQILSSSILLRLLPELSVELAHIAASVRRQEGELISNIMGAAQTLRSHADVALASSYSLRLAITLAVSTALYRYSHIANAYWIPMTALLVLKPALADTANRAIARTMGTLIGAVLASLFIAHFAPGPAVAAACTVLFAWLSYATVNVNYAVFTLFLTSYIVFLLSLASLPSRQVAYHRAVSTIIGGALALAVRLIVIRRRQSRMTCR